MLKMADSVSSFPLGMDAYAGYVNGRWPSFGEAQRIAGAKPTLKITVFLADVGECLDIESGDATPDQAPVYVRMRRKAGVKRPVLYGSASVMPEIVAACKRAGIKRSEYRLWSAHFTYHAHVCSPKACGYHECDGTQWTDKGKPNYDESLLRDDFFASRVRASHPGHPLRPLWELVQGRHTIWKARVKRPLDWVKQLTNSLRGGRIKRGKRRSP